MDLTRRGWAAVACALTLIVGAWLLATPVLLLAAAGVTAWLLAAQLAFVVTLRRERDALTVTLDAPGTPGVGDATTLHLSASGRAELPIGIATGLPAAARPVADDGAPTGSTNLALRLGDAAGESADRSHGTDEATASIAVEWPVAGRYRIGPPRIDARDRRGLFGAEIEADAAVDVTVRSRDPETTHLGEGRDRIAAFGEHTTGRRGPGTEPAELRPYYPGDDLGRIDWNATARLHEAYIAEPEAETDRRTVLLVDHRGSTGVGRSGATPLAYLRHAGLAIVESARDLGDPLGCYCVGDAGVSVEHAPRTMPGQYDTVAESLQGLRPTAERAETDERPRAASAGRSHQHSGGAGGTTAAATSGTPAVPAGVRSNASGDPARATRIAGRLAGDESAFARRLEPLLGDATPYVHRVTDEPLFAAARTYLGRLQGNVWSVILTDGTRCGELRETVKLARRGNDHVLVVLAPPALFGDRLADLDERRRDYEALSEYADSLAAMERVTVRELAPGDAAEVVLSAGGGRA